VEELELALTKMRLKAAPGPNGLSPGLVKDIFSKPHAKLFLLRLFNRYLFNFRLCFTQLLPRTSAFFRRLLVLEYPILLFCFTRCLDVGKVPAVWNTAEMFVLYKGKGPIDQGDSYRAISLTDIVGKLFERVIFARVMTWFEASDLASLPQFGFRPRSSTHDAVFCLKSVIQAHKVFYYFHGYNVEFLGLLCYFLNWNLFDV
jgi:hypothetical protein